MNFDPHRLLIAAEAAILGRTEVVANGSGEQRKATSWVNIIIVALVVMAAIVAHSWITWRRNRELAKLRHERNVARIEAENAAVAEKVAQSIEAQEVLKKQRERLVEEYRILDADIRAEVSRYEADMRAIRRIESWADLELGVGRAE